MPAKCYSVVRGKRMRATRLDECGNPLASATPASLVVTKGFVSVGLTAQTEDGDEITQKNADGDLCISDRSRDQFKRWNLSMQFCQVDPGLLELISNATIEEDHEANPVGVRFPEGAAEESFGLELWTGIPGEDCRPDEPTNYGYMLLPFVIPGVPGDITIENGATTFTMSGQSRGSGGWGSGPYTVVQTGTDATTGDPTYGPLPVPMGAAEHLLLRTTVVAPPDPVCGAQPMP